MARAGELGADQALTFLREVDAINLRRRSRMVDLARAASAAAPSSASGSPSSAPRSSPTATTSATPPPSTSPAPRTSCRAPTSPCTTRRRCRWPARSDPDLTYADDIEDACRDADVVLHLTEWKVYREIDPAKLGTVVARKAVIDGRNALDPAALARGRLDLPRARPAERLSTSAAHR